MNYEIHVADFFSMAADTGDFGSSERLLLVKRLSQATCCKAHIMINSHLLYSYYATCIMEQKKNKTDKFAHSRVRTCLIWEECASTDHVILDVRKHLNARPGICPSSCQHLISFPYVLKALHHSSVFITVDLPVCVSGIW